MKTKVLRSVVRKTGSLHRRDEGLKPTKCRLWLPVVTSLNAYDERQRQRVGHHEQQVDNGRCQQRRAEQPVGVQQEPFTPWPERVMSSAGRWATVMASPVASPAVTRSPLCWSK